MTKSTENVRECPIFVFKKSYPKEQQEALSLYL